MPLRRDAATKQQSPGKTFPGKHHIELKRETVFGNGLSLPPCVEVVTCARRDPASTRWFWRGVHKTAWVLR